MKFEVGQQVFDLRWGWGTILDINYCSRPIKVHFNSTSDYYEHDGRSYKDDFAPSLLTVEQAKLLGYEPPKKKVKKEMRIWVNVYPNNSLGLYSKKEDSDFWAVKNRIACVECVGTYEVEE